MIISEPYVNKPYWFTDTANYAAVWVTPRVISKGATVRPLRSGRGYVVVKLNDTLVISCYFPPSLSYQDYCRALDEIEEVLTANSQHEIIISGDFNAKSPMWGSRKCD